MKVVALHGRHDLRVETRPDPAPGPGQVLVKVAYCGVCGTELHYFQGATSDWRGVPLQLPRVFGHEYAGTVAAVGAGVTTCRVGDHVVSASFSCGACFYCRNGLENFCEEKRGGTGAWAEYTLVPERAIYVLRPDLPLDIASLAEPLACCQQAIDVAALRSGSTVCILGGGPIGLLILALARASGASRTVVSEPAPARRELARRMGADVVVNPLEEDLEQVVRRETGGFGADVAFEAVGRAQTVRQAIDIVRNGGTVVIAGVADPADRLSVAAHEIYSRGLSIRGSHSKAYVFHRAIGWLLSLDLRALLTHTLPLEALPEAMAIAAEGRGAKVLVKP